jgi:hypothetical protein
LAGTRERYAIKIVPRILQLLLKVYYIIFKEYRTVYKAYKERETIGIGK